MDEDRHWRLWLAAAQAGDRRAYAALLREAVPFLRIRARARWPRASAADIEDMVQDTLLALHQSLALYDPARPVAPFLVGILKLRGADTLRRRFRHAARESPIDDVPVTFSGLATKETQEAASEQAKVMDVIAGMSARDQQVLEALKVRELSLREASREIGMSTGALKVASHRAMMRLRQAVTGKDDHGNR